jgi:hypothetical protein
MVQPHTMHVGAPPYIDQALSLGASPAGKGNIGYSDASVQN